MSREGEGDSRGREPCRTPRLFLKTRVAAPRRGAGRGQEAPRALRWPCGGRAGLGQGRLTATADVTGDCTLGDVGDESPSWAPRPDVEQASEIPSQPALRVPWEPEETVMQPPPPRGSADRAAPGPLESSKASRRTRGPRQAGVARPARCRPPSVTSPLQPVVKGVLAVSRVCLGPRGDTHVRPEPELQRPLRVRGSRDTGAPRGPNPTSQGAPSGPRPPCPARRARGAAEASCRPTAACTGGGASGTPRHWAPASDFTLVSQPPGRAFPAGTGWTAASEASPAPPHGADPGPSPPALYLSSAQWHELRGPQPGSQRRPAAPPQPPGRTLGGLLAGVLRPGSWAPARPGCQTPWQRTWHVHAPVPRSPLGHAAN